MRILQALNRLFLKWRIGCWRADTNISTEKRKEDPCVGYGDFSGFPETHIFSG